MQIFRESAPGSGISDSPVRQLYGKKTMPNGKTFLIAPLDIIFMQFDSSGNSIFQPPTIPGTFISDSVRTAVEVVGTITRYDFPPSSRFSVTPVVWITPDPTFDLSTIPDVGISVAPAVTSTQPVTVKLELGDVSGTLVSSTTNSSSYPDGNSQVSAAYQVRLNQPLLEDAHGARVLVGGNTLLGMLITTTQPLVFPAHLIG